MKTPRPAKRSVASLTKQIEACKERIAKERDKLRDLVHEVNEIVDNCDEAHRDLEHAVDTLSQYL